MDNYAGLYLNFVTMEEYRMKRSDVQGTENAENKQANAKVLYCLLFTLSNLSMVQPPCFANAGVLCHQLAAERSL